MATNAEIARLCWPSGLVKYQENYIYYLQQVMNLFHQRQFPFFYSNSSTFPVMPYKCHRVLAPPRTGGLVSHLTGHLVKQSKN